jgi:putative endonuclease
VALRLMGRYNLNFGKASENTAAEYLKRQGYCILEVNYRTKLGEIDIVAKEGKTICFVEVKSRSSLAFGLPKEAVNKRKQHKLSRCALSYLKEKHLCNQSCRFDVLSIIQDERPKLELLRDAFELNGKYSY